MNKMRRVLTLIFLNVAISAVLLELLLRLTAPSFGGQVGVAARYVTTGQPYAQAWRPAWRQSREHYYVLRTDVQDEIQYGSPTVSFRLTTRPLWEGADVGFRTPELNYFVDAVVVGDSFGMCFTEQVDCWVDLLAQSLQAGVVNLSQPVTGTTSHALILRDYGAPLTPPLVIWQFFGNDFNDDYGLSRFGRGETASSSPDCPTPASPAWLSWLRRHSALYAVLETLAVGRYLGAPSGECMFVKPHTVRYGANNEHTLQFGGLYEQYALDMSRPENQEGYALSRQALQQAQELIASWNGKLVVLLIPTREEVYAPLTTPLMGEEGIARLASARLAMLDLCAELSLSCLDATETLTARASAGEALYHVDDMHLNADGNRVLAEWLAEQLR
jgi:hypothetical protein